jgi:putative oxidoreductase
MAHGYAKLSRGPENFAVILSALDIPFPLFTAWATSLLEFFGGIFLIAGAFVSLWSLPLIIVMLTAMFSVHLPNGYSSIKLKAVTASGSEFGAPGYEMNLLYVACLIALAMEGGGLFSVDRWRRSKRVRPKRGIS